MRNEKTLLQQPVPDCPLIEQLPDSKVGRDHFSYHRYRVQMVELNGEKYLGITIFTKEGAPRLRFWQGEGQHGVQFFIDEQTVYSRDRASGKMYYACIDSVFNIESYREKAIFYAEAGDEARARAYLKTDMEPVKELAQRQKKMREEAIRTRDEKNRQKIRERVMYIEAPGENFAQWCMDVPLRKHRYWYFEPGRGKKRKGQCSHCLNRAELEGVKEYGRGTCPWCNSSVEYRSAAKLRNSSGVFYSYEVALYEKSGELLLARNFSVWLRIYSESGRLKRRSSANEWKRCYIGKNGETVESYSRERSNYKVTWDGWHIDHGGPGWALLAPINICEIRREAGISAPIEELCCKGLAGYLHKIIETVGKRPEIEYLIKGGYHVLAVDELDPRWNMSTALLPGRRPEELFGIPRQEMDKVRQAEAGAEVLSISRSLYKCGIVLKTDDIRDMQSLQIKRNDAGILTEMMRLSSPRKAINYLLRQTKRAKKEGDSVLRRWEDYIVMARKAGWNTEHGQILWPKDLDRAHAEVTKSIKAQKDAELCRKIADQGAKLDKLCWSFGGLTIRPAHSQKEIIEEGAALNHCVGKSGYDEEMAKGRTAIFFIREVKKQDKPLATLELDLKTKRVIQCFGAGNRYPGDRVKNFYRKWEKEKVNGQGRKSA